MFKNLSFFIAILILSISSIFAQKIVAFDKHGRVKRIKYYEGEYIKLRTKSSELVIGTIGFINDSSFIVQGKKVELNEVSKVYNTQKLGGFKFFSKLFLLGGAAYFPLVTFNRSINGDDPTFSEEAAIISGSMLTVGIVFKLLANKSYKMSEKRPLKILDLTP